MFSISDPLSIGLIFLLFYFKLHSFLYNNFQQQKIEYFFFLGSSNKRFTISPMFQGILFKIMNYIKFSLVQGEIYTIFIHMQNFEFLWKNYWHDNGMCLHIWWYKVIDFFLYKLLHVNGIVTSYLIQYNQSFSFPVGGM